VFVDIILLGTKPTYLGIVMFETVLYTCILFGVCQSSEAASFCFFVFYCVRETCNDRWPYSEFGIKVDKQQDS
jgi:hypothetical protein